MDARTMSLFLYSVLNSSSGDTRSIFSSVDVAAANCSVDFDIVSALMSSVVMSLTVSWSSSEAAPSLLDVVIDRSMVM